MPLHPEAVEPIDDGSPSVPTYTLESVRPSRATFSFAKQSVGHILIDFSTDVPDLKGEKALSLPTAKAVGLSRQF
jgi:hypothetical protein